MGCLNSLRHHSLFVDQCKECGISIEWQELFPIVVACALWFPQFSGKRLQFWCDNESVVAIINQGHSKAPRIMDLVRFLVLISMKHNFFVRARHVPGVSNGIADALSRFQAQRFRDLAPHADQHPCTNRQCVQSAIGGSSVVMTIVHFIGPEF